MIKPGAVANDYAAVNQGQVKQMIAAAYEEMAASLPNGVGDTTSPQGTGSRLKTIVDKWSTVQGGIRAPQPGAATNDYNAVTIRQLKALASPFYDRLIEVGYTNHYPWEPAPGAPATTPRVPNDFAPANGGQLKNLFCFTFLDKSWIQETLPDWWTTGVKAHLAIKVDSPESVRDKIFVGARKMGTTTVLGSIKVKAPTEKTKLLFYALPGHEIYEVVAGYDQNGNGSLDDNEAAIVFKKTPAGSATSGLQYLDKIIIVTDTQFASSKSSTIGNNVWGTAYAGDLVSAFAHGSATVSNANITRSS